MQKAARPAFTAHVPRLRTEGEALCAKCRAHMATAARRAGGRAHRAALGACQPGIVQLEWCASFNGPARASVHALKYDGERRLVEPLAELMAARWRRAGIGGDMLVPVPVHAAQATAARL